MDLSFILRIFAGSNKKNLIMKKIVLLIVVVLSSFSITAPSTMDSDAEKYRIFYAECMKVFELHELKNSMFSKDNLLRYLELKNAKNPTKILCQAVLETGWFKSRSFTIGNNLFGMKYATRRQTTATGKYLGHAKFNHWSDSVDDYLMWMQYWVDKGHKYKNHYAFLKRIGYAEDPLYNSKLAYIEKNHLNRLS